MVVVVLAAVVMVQEDRCECETSTNAEKEQAIRTGGKLSLQVSSKKWLDGRADLITET